MLKKVTVMLATKYLAIKAKMRAIETRLIIHTLLLRDKKAFLHLLLHNKRCFNPPNRLEDDSITALTEDYKIGIEEDNEHNPSDNIAALISNSNAAPPVSIMQLAENKLEIQEDDEYPSLRHSPFNDYQMGDQSISAIEMVKNAKEGQGEEFRLEDDIDQVADLFIQRFHHQIRMQKFHAN
ncbi:hypothetical protein CDL12_03059 [Handroanthus impetiginosus]|uniref:Uncharacterized protein n=1 Tax=Handroanthus impetiginosus TaxID=429701 RepID=A0A2G9I398_9LAMI|nr:hypothetical protein CDL12_03059 [Handroanthus impetiginosus]